MCERELWNLAGLLAVNSLSTDKQELKLLASPNWLPLFQLFLVLKEFASISVTP
jgi:hypothetical protein